MTDWPPGSPRVLVTDAWLANAGDGAIALALDALVHDVVPGAAVLHAAYQHAVLGPEYPMLALAPPLDELVGTAASGAPPIPGGPSLVESADLVISQGGGFLLEPYRPWPRLRALIRVGDLGVPYAVIGQTIGRFRGAAARRALRVGLGRAALVTVRDASSAAYVAGLGIPPEDIHVTSDLAFLLFDQHGRARGDGAPGAGRARGDGAPVVVILSAESGSAPGDRVAKTALACRVLAEVAARTVGTIVVLSTAQGHGLDGVEDDGPTAEAAVAALSDDDRHRTRVVADFLPPERAIAEIGRARAVVSQRLHPALFGLAQGVSAALLMDAAKTGVFAGADLGPLLCRRPDEPVARARALDAALAPDALRGEALRHALDGPRARAEKHRTLLGPLLTPRANRPIR